MKLTSRALRGSGLAVFGALLSLVGCGGGGGGTTVISLCSLDSFTPNYAANVAHLFTWPSMPVTVYFVQDANYSDARKAIAVAGFNQWVNATGGKISYQIVSSSAGADIPVKFDPTTQNGEAILHFTGLTMTLAEMDIGIQGIAASDQQCIAAHEFGHSLGIDGHSPQQGDLMYAVHFIGDACPVTQRDLNTLETGYCHLFGKSQQLRSRIRITGKEQTTRIH